MGVVHVCGIDPSSLLPVALSLLPLLEIRAQTEVKFKSNGGSQIDQTISF